MHYEPAGTPHSMASRVPDGGYRCCRRNVLMRVSFERWLDARVRALVKNCEPGLRLRMPRSRVISGMRVAIYQPDPAHK